LTQNPGTTKKRAENCEYDIAKPKNSATMMKSKLGECCLLYRESIRKKINNPTKIVKDSSQKREKNPNGSKHIKRCLNRIHNRNANYSGSHSTILVQCSAYQRTLYCSGYFLISQIVAVSYYKTIVFTCVLTLESGFLRILALFPQHVAQSLAHSWYSLKEYRKWGTASTKLSTSGQSGQGCTYF
jgi:hypothetical protein